MSGGRWAPTPRLPAPSAGPSAWLVREPGAGSREGGVVILSAAKDLAGRTRPVAGRPDEILRLRLRMTPALPHRPPPPAHSYRSACIGSTWLARRAGM